MPISESVNMIVKKKRKNDKFYTSTSKFGYVSSKRNQKATNHNIKMVAKKLKLFKQFKPI